VSQARAVQPDDPPGLAAVLDVVRQGTGVDLTGYRRDTVLRRLLPRASARTGDGCLHDYAVLLATDDAEVRALLDDVLVQCSGWFRDPAVWRLLEADVLPGLAAGDRPLVAWVAGCGDGREVWSLAALLAVAAPGRWHLVASDVSERALAVTREAVYRESAGAAPAVLARDAEPRAAGWRVAAPLRERVTVVRHDVRTPPPHEVGPGSCDLLVCRNVLMYLDEATQRDALEQLLGALRPGGALVLGDAEAGLSHRDLLVPVDLAARVYRLIATPVGG
jgi:two-component system, chemotaxis family, CheB/CheR fusion protein